jgi:hypothetical protein
MLQTVPHRQKVGVLEERNLALKNSFVENQCLIIFPPTLYPLSPVFPHTDTAALMGPDDHRHSGERAAYGSFGFGYPRRAETLSHVPPGLRALRKKSPMRQPGQKAVTGRVASHTSTG